MAHNPFAKPRTPSEWLLGSLCWVSSCLGSVGILNWLLPAPLSNEQSIGTLVVVTVGVQVLLWWRVIASAKPLMGPAKGSWVLGVSRCWWLILQFVLVLASLSTLLFLLLALFVILAFSGNASP